MARNYATWKLLGFNFLVCHIELDFFCLQLWVLLATLVLGIGYLGGGGGGRCLKVEFKSVSRGGLSVDIGGKLRSKIWG